MDVRTLYMECRVCGSPLGPISLIGIKIRFGLCSNRACVTRIPMAALMCGPPHMTGPNPCDDLSCACSGRPWWFPGQYASRHLDAPA